jgi:hypothetical protein
MILTWHVLHLSLQFVQTKVVVLKCLAGKVDSVKLPLHAFQTVIDT